MVWSKSTALGSLPLRRPDRPRKGRYARYSRAPRLGGCGLPAGGGLQGLGAVGALPGELGLLAAEVAVGGGLLEDRAVEVEVLAEGAGAHVELGLDQLGDGRVGQLAGAEGLGHQRNRAGVA